MAPEQVAQTVYNNKIDMWSVGIVFDYMLRGSLYFAGDTRRNCLEYVINKPYTIPISMNISLNAKRLMEKLLEKDPSYRL